MPFAVCRVSRAGGGVDPVHVIHVAIAIVI